MLFVGYVIFFYAKFYEDCGQATGNNADLETCQCTYERSGSE